MASGEDLLNPFAPVRGLILGYPGGGKTGAIAALLKAGFKVRLQDFDGNPDPILRNVPRSVLKNLDIMQLKGLDPAKMGDKVMESDGIPQAFPTAVKAVTDGWKYTKADGTKVDLGRLKDWGPDTVYVLDSMTTMGESAMWRASKLKNRIAGEITDGVYGLAMGEQERFIKYLMQDGIRAHVLVLGHLRIIGPRDIRKGDSDILIDTKRAIADLITPRLFPSALGWALPQTIGKEFPMILLARRVVRGNKVTHELTDVSGEELDLKYPGGKLPDKLTVEDDGLLKVFEELSPGSVELVRRQLKENAA